MTPEAQRILIAEFCGWLIHGCAHENSGHRYSAPLGTSPFLGRHALPDYLNDLNAMHEAESLLSREQLAKLADFLTITTNARESATLPEGFERLAECIGIIAHATAAQRAEALLRTIGKWQTEREPNK
jgi:hypothetical protein